MRKSISRKKKCLKYQYIATNRELFLDIISSHSFFVCVSGDFKQCCLYGRCEELFTKRFLYLYSYRVIAVFREEKFICKVRSTFVLNCVVCEFYWQVYVITLVCKGFVTSVYRSPGLLIIVVVSPSLDRKLLAFTLIGFYPEITLRYLRNDRWFTHVLEISVRRQHE